MDTIFFWASKLVWLLISPGSVIVLLGLFAWLSLMLGWQRLSRNLFIVRAAIDGNRFPAPGRLAHLTIGKSLHTQPGSARTGRWHYRAGRRSRAETVSHLGSA